MAALHIRLVGGFVIWAFKKFKGSLKDYINDYTLAFTIGMLTILFITFLSIYFYSLF